MSNFMEFLEKMGQDAQLRYATNDQLEQALTGAQIDPAVRAAVLAGDRCRLEVLLGATANTFCGVLVPEGDEDTGQRVTMKNFKQERAVNHAAAGRHAAVA